MEHDWSNRGYGPNGVPLNPDVNSGAMDGSSALLRPGACTAAMGLRGCLCHWLASLARRCFLGVRRPMSGRLGVYFFLPFDLCPFQKWNDCCVMELLRLVAKVRPSLLIIDFVDDLRLVELSGDRPQLSCDAARHMELQSKVGVRSQRGGVEGMVRERMRVRMTEEKCVTEKESSLRRMAMRAGFSTFAGGTLQTALYLNSTRRWVAGRVCHLGSGWDAAHTSGVIEKWPQGPRSADCRQPVRPR